MVVSHEKRGVLFERKGDFLHRKRLFAESEASRGYASLPVE